MIPEKVRAGMPTESGPCTIHHIGGHYHVYPYESHWDPAARKAVTTTGRCVGKINENGVFVANRHGSFLLGAEAHDGSTRIHACFGLCEALSQLAPRIEDQLRECFPRDFLVIETLAMMRLKGRVAARLCHSHHLNTWLRVLCPGLHTGGETLRDFVRDLGRAQTPCVNFMRCDVAPGSTMLVDGTSHFAVYEDGLSQKGYNPDHRTRRQVRLLHLFDRSTNAPCFHAVLQGSSVDTSALVDQLRIAGVRKAIVVGDRNFHSRADTEWMRQAGLEYVLPLKANTRKVRPDFHGESLYDKMDGVFEYRSGRVIAYKWWDPDRNGDRVCTYFDAAAWNDRLCAQIRRLGKKEEKPDGHGSCTDMAKLDRRAGYFSLLTNLDEGAAAVFLTYKERSAIGLCFDHLKNVIEISGSYAHDDNAMRGWAFLNHISLLCFYALVDAMRRTCLDEEYSHDEVIKYLSEVEAYDCTGPGGKPSRHFTRPLAKTAMILDTLGVDLTIRAQPGLTVNSAGDESDSQ